MSEKTVTVGSAIGLHARPAAIIAEAVVNAGVPVTLSMDGVDVQRAMAPIERLSIERLEHAPVVVEARCVTLSRPECMVLIFALQRRSAVHIGKHWGLWLVVLSHAWLRCKS